MFTVIAEVMAQVALSEAAATKRAHALRVTGVREVAQALASWRCNWCRTYQRDDKCQSCGGAKGSH